MRLIRLPICVNRGHNDRHVAEVSLDVVRQVIGAPPKTVHISSLYRMGVIAENHYHATKRECFQVISGTLLVALREVSSGEEVLVRLTSDPDDRDHQLLVVPPGVAHAVLSISHERAQLMVYASHEAGVASDDFHYEVLTQARANELLADPRYAPSAL